MIKRDRIQTHIKLHYGHRKELEVRAVVGIETTQTYPVEHETDMAALESEARSDSKDAVMGVIYGDVWEQVVKIKRDLDNKTILEFGDLTVLRNQLAELMKLLKTGTV